MASLGLRRLISGTERELTLKKGIVIHNIASFRKEKGDLSSQQHASHIKPAAAQPTEALKDFFDRIPLFSIPGIHNAGVLEISSNECMGDAITRLHKENVMVAPVRDESMRESEPFSDHYIGLVEFAGMVLWALQEFEEAETQSKNKGLVLSKLEVAMHTGATQNGEMPEQPSCIAESGFLTAEVESEGFFGTLQQHPSVRDSKVAVMSRFFRWGPYIPVSPEDTLLHVLLLLSKYRLKAVPVVDSDQPQVRGFITQDAAVQLLLQCAGLEWFDAIADKQLCDFRFEVDQMDGEIVHVDSNDSILSAMMCMWKYRLGGVPVIDCKTRKIMGNFRNVDIRLLLDKPELFDKRRILSIEEFMKLDSKHVGGEDFPAKISLEQDLGSRISAATLSLANVSLPRMLEPITSKSNDTLKVTMEKLVKARSDQSFLLNDKMEVTGVITLRDIIIQFTPPFPEALDQWGGFFESVS